MTIEAGTQIGKYKVQSLLGAGGMGEVYHAQDTELNRPVALKLLPEDVALDQQRMQRITQEARSASALNHPNILTVYAIGQTDGGSRFFVAELVNGVTLREHMRGRRLKFGEALDLCAQIASALAAAHDEGIIHRDIKPENVMLRPDRIVKVLDFGLAKVPAQPVAAVLTAATTQALVQTNPGTFMGTVAYASPEQARGEAVDARTDIWSLGVVLYEMLTGRQPFKGKSVSHTLISIQEDEPPPLAQHIAEVPELLQEIISDTLAKDRDARLTAKQTLAKLQRLKRRLDAGIGLDRTATPDAPVASSATGAATTATDTLHLLAQSRRRRKIAAALALVAFGGLVSIYLLVWRSTATGPDAPLLKFTKLTTDQVVTAVISPDGKYFACVTSNGGKQSLWLRQVAESSKEGRNIILPTEVNYANIAFSPGGDYLYYIISENNSGYGTIYRWSVILGGEPQKIVSDASGTVTFSPNGKRIAFKRRLLKTRGVVSSATNEYNRGKQIQMPDADRDEYQLLISDENGGREQVLITRRDPDSIGSLAWSPDGQEIAYVNENKDGDYENIETVNVADQKIKTISSARWRDIGSLAWLSDGGGLIITGRAKDASAIEPAQIWYVSYPGGEARELTNEITNYVSLTGNSNALLAIQDNRFSEISISLVGGTAPPRQPPKNYAYISCLAWMPDGRIVYDSEESGNYDIWMMNTDDFGKTQLTFSTADSDITGAVSPDGRFIIYRSYHKKENPDDKEEIILRRMDTGGGNVKVLVRNLKFASAMHVSPDSQWVYYTSPDSSEGSALWKVSIDGGHPTKLQEWVESSRVSPNGKQFVAFDVRPNAPRKIVIFPAEGDGPVRSLDLPPGIGDMLNWSPDGDAINYIATLDGAANVWRLPLNGGPPRHLTDWKSDGDISWFAWSHDGKQLGIVRHTSTTDLVLISFVQRISGSPNQ